MEPLQILTPTGDTRFVFPEAEAYRRRELKGFVVSHEWYGPSSRKVDACIVIWPARVGLEQGCWVVSRRAISAYTDGNMTPTPYCLMEAFEALAVMNMSQTKQDIRNVVDVLLDAIPTLIEKMGAVPLWAKRRAAGDAMWEAVHTDVETGKVLSEAAI